MRWLVGILLLANLIIFLWGYSRTPTPQITKAPSPNIPTLNLLREVSPVEQGEQLAQATGSGASVQAATVQPEAPRLAALEETESPQGVVTEPQPATTAPPPQVAAATEPAAELEALAESVDAETVVEAPAPEPPAVASEPEPTPEPVVLQCGRLGPFASEATAEQAQAGLEGLGGEANLAVESMQQPAGYWVLIPPLASRSEGKAKAAELKAAGIVDIWLLAKGTMRNAISLGQFSNENNAKRRAAAVEAAGFNPEVRQKTKRVKQFWLEFQVSEDLTLPSSLRPLPDDITVVKQPCP